MQNISSPAPSPPSFPTVEKFSVPTETDHVDISNLKYKPHRGRISEGQLCLFLTNCTQMIACKIEME